MGRASSSPHGLVGSVGAASPAGVASPGAAASYGPSAAESGLRGHASGHGVDAHSGHGGQPIPGARHPGPGAGPSGPSPAHSPSHGGGIRQTGAGALAPGHAEPGHAGGVVAAAMAAEERAGTIFSPIPQGGRAGTPYADQQRPAMSHVLSPFGQEPGPGGPPGAEEGSLSVSGFFGSGMVSLDGGMSGSFTESFERSPGAVAAEGPRPAGFSIDARAAHAIRESTALLGGSTTASRVPAQESGATRPFLPTPTIALSVARAHHRS